MTTSEHPIDREEVMAYLDGELPAARAQAIVAHLDHCADCRMLVAKLREVSRELMEWQVDPAPATLDQPIVAALQQRSSQIEAVRGRRWHRGFLSTWRAPRWGWVSAAATATAILAVLVWLPLRDQAPRARASGDVQFAGQRILPRAQNASGESVDSRLVVGGGQELILGSMIARTARLRLLTDDMPRVRTEIERILRDHAGRVGNLTAEGEPSHRTLDATLRVPSDRLNSALAALKTLGRVQEESQNTEDLTEQHVDLRARLANARTTEQRLQQLLQNRTDNVADLLAAEREMARVREEIERLDARRLHLESRVEFSTIELHVGEEAPASVDMGASVVSTRLRNALIEGYQQALESALAASLFVLRVGPVLVLWLAILFWPLWLLRRKLRPVVR